MDSLIKLIDSLLKMLKLDHEKGEEDLDIVLLLITVVIQYCNAKCTHQQKIEIIERVIEELDISNE